MQKPWIKHSLFRPLPSGFVKDVARPDYWVPDQDITQCHQCSKTFTAAMSKHHCRACGQGVCGPCSTHIRPVPSRGWDHPVRVCDSCHARTDSLWAFLTRRTSQSAFSLPQMIHKNTVNPGTAAQQGGLIIQHKMAKLESALVLREEMGSFEA